MDEISLRLKIGNRDYPMKVKPEEEEVVKMAARQVNEKIKAFKNQFGIDDKQDLLAMVAFDCMMNLLKGDGDKPDFRQAGELLNELNQKLLKQI